MWRQTGLLSFLPFFIYPVIKPLRRLELNYRHNPEKTERWVKCTLTQNAQVVS
jgi:hypothetical protein